MRFFDQFSTADQLNRAVKSARLVGPTAAPGLASGKQDMLDAVPDKDQSRLPQDEPQFIAPSAPTPSGLPMPIAGAPQAAPRQDAKQMAGNMGKLLVQYGTPAQRVQGMQMIIAASKPDAAALKQQQKAADMQEIITAIDDAKADEETKQRARTVARMGGSVKEVMEAMGYGAKGQAAELAKREMTAKTHMQYAQDMSTIDILRRDRKRALELMEQPLTEGILGKGASYLWKAPAYQLESHVRTFRAHIWMDYIRRMREASKTGGAVGQVTEREGLWLQSMEGALDPFGVDHEVLKQNMEGIIAGKAILAEMRIVQQDLIEGKEGAVERMLELEKKLSTLNQDIVARSSMDALDQAKIKSKDGPKWKEIEKRYGIE